MMAIATAATTATLHSARLVWWAEQGPRELEMVMKPIGRQIYAIPLMDARLSTGELVSSSPC